MLQPHIYNKRTKKRREPRFKNMNNPLKLVIVGDMWLTGFDAPVLHTLFVGKNLRYHGLMQTFFRTNRIHNTTKTCGKIVTFRDLEQATIDAIILFGKSNTRRVVMKKSYTSISMALPKLSPFIEEFKGMGGSATRVASVASLDGYGDEIDNLMMLHPNCHRLVHVCNINVE